MPQGKKIRLLNKAQGNLISVKTRDVFDKAKELLFPQGKSTIGEIGNFGCALSDFMLLLCVGLHTCFCPQFVEIAFFVKKTYFFI